MTIAISGTTGITLDGQFNSASSMGFKNRIINGGMVLDQRNAGASVTASSAGAFTYTLDRWNYYASQASKFTVQQNAGSVTLPVGYGNYLGVTSSSAYSVVSGDIFSINQAIEGFNTSDLAWGTANAATVTLSFWVRSSLTGTFGGSVLNNAYNRSYPFTYTISAANTWEQKTITIAGDTSGTWVGATNSVGMRINFSLGTGSTYSGTAGAWSGSQLWSATGATSVVGTNGATFYITGVQLEKGSTATSFDYRPYGIELQLCQRYFQSFKTTGTAYTKFGLGICNNATTVYAITIAPKVTMRATPTLLTATACYCNDGLNNLGPVSSLNNLSSADGICFDATIPSGGTQFRPVTFGDAGTSTAVFTATAEL